MRTSLTERIRRQLDDGTVYHEDVRELLTENERLEEVIADLRHEQQAWRTDLGDV